MSRAPRLRVFQPVARAMVLGVFALALGACASDQPGAPLFRDGPFTITGLPDDSVLVLGTTAQLQAVAPDGANDVQAIDVAWSTSDAGIATVSDDGLLRGVGVGEADVVASGEGGLVKEPITVRFGIRLPGRDDDAVTTSLLDGAVRVRVPSGAVRDDAVLHVRPAKEVLESPLLVEGTAFEFGPAGMRVASPITLWLAYPGTVSSADRPRVRIHRQEAGAWLEVPGGAVELDDDRARASIGQLGTYALVRRAPPVAFAIAAGDGQEAGAGSPVPVAPSVLLRNATQQPAADVAVRFEVTSGGGAIDGEDTGISAADGTASLPGAWRLGESMGPNTLRATVVGYDLEPIEFRAMAIVPPPEIHLSATEVNFDALIGSDAPEPRVVHITNAGGQELAGLSVGPIIYTTVSGWLSLTLSQTVAPASITVTVSADNLTPGSHLARVPVRSSVPGVTPETLLVQVGAELATVSRLEVTQDIDGVISGRVASTQPRVELQTSSGARVRSATGVVTAALATGDGTLRGTTTAPVAAGVATFTDLRVDGAGEHRLRFSFEDVGQDGSSFAVTQVLARLVIQVQPADAEEGERFDTQPVIVLLDEADLLMRNSSIQVTASIASGGGDLEGSRTRRAENGVVRFTNLRISDEIGFHRLRFSTSDPDLSVVSELFLVWPD